MARRWWGSHVWWQCNECCLNLSAEGCQGWFGHAKNFSCHERTKDVKWIVRVRCGWMQKTGLCSTAVYYLYICRNYSSHPMCIYTRFLYCITGIDLVVLCAFWNYSAEKPKIKLSELCLWHILKSSTLNTVKSAKLASRKKKFKDNSDKNCNDSDGILRSLFYEWLKTSESWQGMRWEGWEMTLAGLTPGWLHA